MSGSEGEFKSPFVPLFFKGENLLSLHFSLFVKEAKGRFGKRGRNKVRVRLPESFFMIVTGVNFFFSLMLPSVATGGDRLVALYSSHAVPYSTPWVAEELGLFKKYDLDFDFVYIPSSSTATAGM